MNENIKNLDEEDQKRSKEISAMNRFGAGALEITEDKFDNKSKIENQLNLDLVKHKPSAPPEETRSSTS